MTDAIAIVGMGCLFPDAEKPSQFWQNLLDEKDSTTNLLSDDILGVNPDLYFHEEKGTADKICYSKNGYIRNFEFNSSGYNIPGEELDKLDKLFKWTIYAVEQALNDTKVSDNSSIKKGLVLGNIGMPTDSGKKIMNGFYNEIIEPYVQDVIGNKLFKFKKYWNSKDIPVENLSAGSDNTVIAAQALGLNGPCLTLDAACSSGLYAIKMASYYLSSGKADVMMAGSICAADHIYINHGFNVLQAFPEIGGSCIPFDKNSKGLKAGEGAGVIALKRLEDARRDKDKIYGVIDSIGLSNDGGAKHILVPDFKGQVLALERAYAGIDKVVDYVECHATGTPVGDQVELNSMEHFFSSAGKLPLFGANKGNVGHMLTASSMASIFKVLLALKHQKIPSTIHLENLVKTKKERVTVDNVVTKTIPWFRGEKPRRAGINAFGFGGVNGHMVVKEYAEDIEERYTQEVIPKKKEEKCPISIIGMGVRMANTDLLEEFYEIVKEGRQQFRDLPHTRWSGIEKRKDILAKYQLTGAPKGAYDEKFEFNCSRFKLPPNYAGMHLIGHMSLLNLATAAYEDAGYELGEERQNIAVIVAGENEYMGYRYQARNEAAWQIKDTITNCGIDLTESQLSDLERIVKDSLFPMPNVEGITGGIGNITASRVSAALKLNGPSFTVCSQENSVFNALELAEFMLTLDEVEAVILGSQSFGGGLENVLFRNQKHNISTSGSGLSFSTNAEGVNIGEGGGVIVLKREDAAKADKNRIYAHVSSLEFLQSNISDGLDFKPDAESVRTVCEKSLGSAGLNSTDIDYVEAHASGIDLEDKAEISGLSDIFKAKGRDGKKCVIGSVKSCFGHLGASAGISSIIKTALCLYKRQLPGSPNWSGPKYPDEWGKSCFTVPSESLEWSVTEGKKRTALISSMGANRSYALMVLHESSVFDGGNKISQQSCGAENRKTGLFKTIYLGRKKTIPEMILSEENRAVFCVSPPPEKIGKVGERLEPVDSKVKDLIVEKDWESASLSNSRSVDKQPAMSLVSEEANEYYDGAAWSYTEKDGTVCSVSSEKNEININSLKMREYKRNIETQLSYLKTEQQFYQRLTQILQLNNSVTLSSESPIRHTAVEDPNKDRLTVNEQTGKRGLFDYQQLVEMTDGKISNVLGNWYAESDTYPIRTRMPSPPFMFVSRITKLTAKRGVLEPCTVEWEVDFPFDSWFVTHGLVPAFVSLESSHAMIVAFMYIGCDQMLKGKLKYRAIDSQTTTYSAMPKAGEVLRGRVAIKSFIKAGTNILISYEYDGYVGDRHSFKLTATSGFFPLKNIQKAKGVSAEKIFNSATKCEPFIPFLNCEKNRFTAKEIVEVQNGKLENCFGRGYGVTISPGLYAPAAKMLDRISSVDVKGGAWGAGIIVGECDINPSNWVFKAHFKNDPVMPGTLIVEGCEQVIKFYLYYIGVHSQTHLTSCVLENHKYSAKFRGEVKCEEDVLKYRLSVKKIDLLYLEDSQKLKELKLIFIAEIIYRGSVIGLCDNLGVKYVS